MSPAPLRLLHGTTRSRADRLVGVAPDPGFVEPGGNRSSRADGISFVIAGAEDLGLGSAERYARAKAANFPTEGGPAILEVEVPAEIVDIVRNDPVSGLVAASGEVRFESDVGLDELRRAWHTLSKRVTLL